jgi:hypothetical protein
MCQVEFYSEFNPALANDEAHLEDIITSYKDKDNALFAALEYKYEVAKIKGWSRQEQFARALEMGADMGILQRYRHTRVRVRTNLTNRKENTKQQRHIYRHNMDRLYSSS